MPNQKPPLVSVVITTKNEEKNIKNCLDSIVKQTYPQNKIEIIVVDNNSTDKTKEIAISFKHLNFKTLKLYFYNHGPERSAQRNFGAKKSKGEYYLYLDADMTLDKNVICECVYNLSACLPTGKADRQEMQEDKKTIALYIPEIILGENFWCKVRRFERSFYNGTTIDCVRFIRMKDFTAVLGFDETMSGPEDWDFDKKIRRLGKVDIIKSPLYHNEIKFNIKNYLNKKSYYFKNFDRYINKWGKNDPNIKKQLGFYYRYLGVFIENKKWKKILRHPFLSLGVFILRVLVGWQYLKNKIA